MFPHFPFWFIDTWWDEIGEFLNAKIEIDLAATLPDGKGLTHGLTDIYFWAEFFDVLRPMRVLEASRLAKLAYGEFTPQFQSFLTELPNRQRACASKIAHLRTAAFIQEWENNRSEDAPSRHYAKVKANAETLMGELQNEAARFLASRFVIKD